MNLHMERDEFTRFIKVAVMNQIRKKANETTPDQYRSFGIYVIALLEVEKELTHLNKSKVLKVLSQENPSPISIDNAIDEMANQLLHCRNISVSESKMSEEDFGVYTLAISELTSNFAKDIRMDAIRAHRKM